MFKKIRLLFDLRDDQDDSAIIDASIRAGMVVRGTNLWVLMFAILIASVGLNVNSTAVIIGAMLISPLMGPILAIGYGAGIRDYRLIRGAARSLLIFVALSLVTSFLYFLVSPLAEPQSELIARTSPNLWDVLIAFFGGCAGIVAVTRKGGSTVIPGAAIATALMPPICTMGYGLASGNWTYVAGAAYLFLINAFFIALATYLFSIVLKLPVHKGYAPHLQRRAHLWVGFGVLALALPSGYLAYGLVRNQMFLASSREVASMLERQNKSIVLRTDVQVDRRVMAVTLSGDHISTDLAARLEQRLRSNGFDDARLSLRHLSVDKIEISSMRENLRRELFGNADGRVNAEHKALEVMQARLDQISQIKGEQAELIRELMMQNETISTIAVVEGRTFKRTQDGPTAVLMLTITATPLLGDRELERIRAGLLERYPNFPIELLQLSQRPSSDLEARKGLQPAIVVKRTRKSG